MSLATVATTSSVSAPIVVTLILTVELNWLNPLDSSYVNYTILGHICSLLTYFD